MNHPETNDFPFVERRSGKDRRAKPSSPFSRFIFTGSRRGCRRKEDARVHFYVDIYSPSFILLLMFTLFLSICDALLTMRLVASHFQELNPVMDFFLKLGPVPFIIVKLVLTSFGLITLLVLKNYHFLGSRVRTAAILVLFPLLYLILVSYEIVMVIKHG